MRDLIKAILKTGSGSLLTMLFMMTAVKLIASRLGPEALGWFSLNRQFVVAGSALFVTGGQTALVQGFASREGKDREELVSTGFLLLCAGSLLAGLVFLIVGLLGAGKFLSGPDQVSLVPLTALAIVISGPMAFVFGALNAARRIGRLAISQAANAASMAVLVWVLLPALRSHRPLWFALILATSQVPGTLIGILFLRRDHAVGISFGCVSGKAASQFLRVSFATVAAAGLQAWTVLFLRGSVAGRLGFGAAGLFDAGWSISMVYVMLILGSFSTYYLPTLAAADSTGLKLIDDVLRTTLLLVLPLIVLIMAFRPLLLTWLYSTDFLAVSGLMHWMLIGDFFKVLSFVVAMPMLARADMRAFLAGELGWNLLMVIGTQFALRFGFGLEAIGVMFGVSYLAYFIFALCYCARRLRWHWPSDLRVEFGSALIILAFVSYATWSLTEVRWTPTVFALLGAVLQVALVLRRRAEAAEDGAGISEARA